MLSRKAVNEMSPYGRLCYFCGGKITVGRVTQVMDDRLVVSYTARVRGVPISVDGEWLHQTQEDALQCGRSVMEQLAQWPHRG